MIIYNITTQVSWSVHERWRIWMNDEHLPAMMKTDFFSHHQFVRLLEVDDTDGPTYALQLYVRDDRSIDEYKKLHLPAMQQRERALWSGTAYSFSSLMRVIN